jgi:Domain of unknown function (DUF1842)
MLTVAVPQLDKEAQMPIDVYLVKLLVGNEGMPETPILHIFAMVDAPTGDISGQAEITQAVAPPGGIIRIRDLHGQVRLLAFDPAVRIVTLTGSYTFSFPPPAIGEVVAPFSATLVVGHDDWNGRGSFSYGGTDITDVPVNACEA